jgi:hypothetical protein
VHGEQKHLQPHLREVEFKIPLLFFLVSEDIDLWLEKNLHHRCMSILTQKHKIVFCAFLYSGSDSVAVLQVVKKILLFSYFFLQPYQR